MKKHHLNLFQNRMIIGTVLSPFFACERERERERERETHTQKSTVNSHYITADRQTDRELGLGGIYNYIERENLWTRQGKTRHDKTRHDRHPTGQDRTEQDKTRQDKTRQDKTRQDKTRQDKTRQDKTRLFVERDTCGERDRVDPSLTAIIWAQMTILISQGMNSLPRQVRE
jgi:hypothetical protein